MYMQVGAYLLVPPARMHAFRFLLPARTVAGEQARTLACNH